jgi:hypothetical protein
LLARNPLAKVKRDRKNLQAAVNKGNNHISLLKAKSKYDQQKIITLKNCNNQLMMGILSECRALNKFIDKEMIETFQPSTKAFVMMIEADRMSAEAKAQVIAEQSLANARVRKERVHHSRESARLHQQLQNKVKKHNQEQEASIKLMVSKSNKKYDG